jgi:hypothetical protein
VCVSRPSIGVASFFSLLDHGHGSPTAMTRTLLISAGLLAVAFVFSFLLPRDARMDEV